MTFNYLSSKPIKNKIKAEDIKDDKSYAVVLYNAKDIDSFRKEMGDKGNGIEYQIHYRALNIKASKDDVNFVVSIPLIYFNYIQGATGGSVTYSIPVIEKLSSDLKELSSALYSELFAKDALGHKISELIKSKLSSFDITYVISGMNNIHKHPSGVRSLSGTDLDLNDEVPGICFPFHTTSQEPIVSSVFLHRNHNDKTEVSCSQFRIADGSIDEKLTYKRFKSLTYVKGYMPDSSDFEKLFVNQTKVESYVCTDGLQVETEFIKEIISIFEETDYEPMKFVDLENLKNMKEYNEIFGIEEKKVTYGKKRKKSGFGYGWGDDLYEDEYEDDIIIHENQTTFNFEDERRDYLIAYLLGQGYHKNQITCLDTKNLEIIFQKENGELDG